MNFVILWELNGIKPAEKQYIIAVYQMVLTADRTLVRGNSGVEIAMFKEVNGVPMIDAKNLYTENLVVNNGARIGAMECN